MFEGVGKYTRAEEELWGIHHRGKNGPTLT